VKSEVAPIYYSDERAKDYIFSDINYNVDIGLVALKSLGVASYDNLRELKPFRIGVSRGYTNSEEFDAADYLNKEVAQSPKLNMRKLFRGRIDLTVGEFDVLRYEMAQEQLIPERLEYLDPSLQSHGLYIMASRKTQNGQELIDDFNRGLVSMMQDDSYRQILRKYLNRI
jgi:polar amino acid transport system substrate-binding protein